MFSAFLSRLRLPLGGSTQSGEEIDDTSSLNRSLNLPWPVTESATNTPSRRNGGPGSIHSAQGVSIAISNPIPRTTPNSLTGFGHDDAGSTYAGGIRRVPIGSSATTGFGASPASGQWYEPEKLRSRRLYPPEPTQSEGSAPTHAYAPPEVVRLDSGAFSAAVDAQDDNEDDEANSPPPGYAYAYTANPSPTSYAVPYPHPSPNHSYIAKIPPTDNHNIRQLTASTPYRAAQSSPELDKYENEADLYASPFDSDSDEPPIAPASAISTTSTSSPPSSPTKAASGSGSGNKSMSKARWGLKLQLQELQTQASASMPYLLAGRRQEASHSTMASAQATPPAFPDVDAPNVDTDVYKHAYNYPLAKQLSPIAEQDYFSPTPQSEADARSFKFGRSAGIVGGSRQGSARASPAVESIMGSLTRGRVSVAEGDDAGSMKTRTGSMGSVRTTGNNNGNVMNLSRAPSMSITASGSGGADGTQRGVSNPSPAGTPIGSEFSRPSPFINRHLNRTTSQTSSKSDSQLNVGQTPIHTPILPGTPRGEGPGGSSNRTIAHLSTSTIIPRSIGTSTANINSTSTPKEIVQTPTSAATTGTVAGTIYTPTSAIQLSPTGPQTPSSPDTGSTPTITVQPPSGAVLADTPPVPQGPIAGASVLPKIPSLPAMQPMDMRFSMLSSTAPRDRTSRTSSLAASTKKDQSRVDKMPVIHASVEGRYEEEGEDEEDSSEGDDEEDEEGEQEEDDYEEEEYERESLHAESFVTAGGSNHGDPEARKNDPEGGLELTTLGKRNRSSSGSRYSSRLPSNAGSVRSETRTAGQDVIGGRATPGSVAGDSFIHRRWERDAALGFGLAAPLSSSPTTTTFRLKSPTNSRWPFRLNQKPSSSLTPAFWAFWLGFICPMLWLVGGWHFTNAGEMPPKYTLWEWYFWNRRWSARRWARTIGGRLSDIFMCRKQQKGPRESNGSGIAASGVTFAEQQQRRKGKRRSNSQSKARAGKIYPSLPRWIAEKQSTDDGRMRLNDPKRSLRGISFGYPFISRPPTSQDSCASHPNIGHPPASLLVRILVSPNRALDQLYGVKLREVRGRPESGRRMFDPWIQRCRYAFCYGMLLLAVGLCTASVLLIIVNTRKLGTH